MTPVNISVVIPTYNRVDKLRVALRSIIVCMPPPAEIIVHIDAGDKQTAIAVRSEFPDVQLIESTDRMGPGGGRNRLLAAASHSLVASFDDDSYPVDLDYFARLEKLFSEFPRAAVLSAAIFHEDEPLKPDNLRRQIVADFVGCGCAYRRDLFLQTTGFVPLPLAYGMEEVDLALRFHSQGKEIVWSSWLRVKHETTRQHQASPKVTAASIANLFLLTYLRYPISCWWVGLAQVMGRIFWLLRNHRWRGIVMGLLQIPRHILKYAHYRATISTSDLRSYLKLRKKAIEADVGLPNRRSTDSQSAENKHLIRFH